MNQNRGEMFKDQSGDGRTKFESQNACQGPILVYTENEKEGGGGKISNLSSF
jgi:hypothetical protein